MAFKAFPFVAILLLGVTFITNEAVSLGVEKIKRMETEAQSMSMALMSAERSAKAMESVFYRSQEVHTKSLAKLTDEMSNEKALKVFHKMNHTDPVLIQLAEQAMSKGKAGLRGLLNKRHKSFSDPNAATSGGAVTNANSQKTNQGVDGVRDMMNEMIAESQSKYDVEIDRCTSFYASQCMQMEIVRGKVSGANARAANARALMADAQACINHVAEEIPELTEQKKDYQEKCKTDKAKLKKRQTILEEDLKGMGTILELVDKSCTSFIQTSGGSGTALLQDGEQSGQVEMCVDECTGENFLRLHHQEHRLKSSVGIKLLGEAVSDLQSGYGQAASFLQTNMSRVVVVADSDTDSHTDPGKTNVKSNTPPPPQTQVPANPCVENGASPENLKKRAAKCVIRGDCMPMKERFLQVRSSMEEEVDVLKQAQEDLHEHCQSVAARLDRSIKTQEELDDKCQTNLANAQEKQNDAAKEADDTAKEHHELHEELDKNMKSCSDNYLGFEGEICALRKIRKEVYEKLKSSGQTPDFQDCTVGKWDPDQCSAECGGGTQTLTRKVVLPPKQGAKCLPLTAVKSCNMHPCPIDCKLGVWEKYSACSADCGGGIQSKVRELIVHPKYGGKSCEATEHTRQCNNMACDQDCDLSEWTEWTECSKACDGGTSKRQKFVKTQATGTGTCADLWSPERLQYRGCNSDPCTLTVGKETMKCKAKIDVILLIDGSGSLGQKGWEAELAAAQTLISAFEGDTSEMHLGAIVYSGPSSWSGVENCFRKFGDADHLKKVCKIDVLSPPTKSIAEVKEKVKNYVWPKGSTLTSLALATAWTQIDEGRADAKAIVIAITDGRPLFKWYTRYASYWVRKKARLMWVPVTRYAPLAFIRSLATRRWQENVVKIDTFDDLKNNKNTITNHLISDLCPKADIIN